MLGVGEDGGVTTPTSDTDRRDADRERTWNSLANPRRTRRS